MATNGQDVNMDEPQNAGHTDVDPSPQDATAQPCIAPPAPLSDPLPTAPAPPTAQPQPVAVPPAPLPDPLPTAPTPPTTEPQPIQPQAGQLPTLSNRAFTFAVQTGPQVHDPSPRP
ncbi:hypothetical protein FRC09_004846, partial [Ceratobasidium sp. 395]